MGAGATQQRSSPTRGSAPFADGCNLGVGCADLRRSTALARECANLPHEISRHPSAIAICPRFVGSNPCHTSRPYIDVLRGFIEELVDGTSKCTRKT